MKIMECIKNASDETADAVAAFWLQDTALHQEIKLQTFKNARARIDYESVRNFTN